MLMGDFVCFGHEDPTTQSTDPKRHPALIPTPHPPVQKQNKQESTVEWGSILCGYGEGAMRPSPGTSDKAVLFSLPTAEAAVFFNRELVPLFEVLAEMPDGTGLLGACVCRGG